MKKILFSYPVPEECVAQYRGKYELMVPEKPLSYEEALALVPDYDAYFILSNRGDKAVLDAGKKMKVIANFGVGYDNIDWKYATEKGIAVVNTPTQVTDATAEHTVALMVSVMRGITRYDHEVRNDIWNAPMFSDRNCEITDRTLGIMGFGRIGKLVCQKAQGLGMKVVYYDKFRAKPEVEEAFGITYMEFDDVLKTADCVTLHMPYIPENRHLFNLETFNKMRKGAYLINCARGPIVNEADLVTALKEGIIKGAGLDVYEFEPNVTPELKELDNVVLTPHAASCTMKARLGMAKEALSGIVGVLEGEKPYNVVNPQTLK
ncbi:MAG: NAD(P)-dependent oxidoreductase [Oscillospiraceae bacterium]